MLSPIDLQSDNQKKKEKEKAKKLSAQESSQPAEGVAAAPSSGQAPSSSSAKVIPAMDPEQAKIEEAERMAKQLLEVGLRCCFGVIVYILFLT